MTGVCAGDLGTQPGLKQGGFLEEAVPPWIDCWGCIEAGRLSPGSSGERFD